MLALHGCFMQAAAVLERLSTSLQISVLRAAPSLPALLATLPPHFHPTVLRTIHTSVDATASLDLRLGSLTPREALAAASALRRLTHLTSLAISEPPAHLYSTCIAALPSAPPHAYSPPLGVAPGDAHQRMHVHHAMDVPGRQAAPTLPRLKLRQHSNTTGLFSSQNDCREAESPGHGRSLGVETPQSLARLRSLTPQVPAVTSEPVLHLRHSCRGSKDTSDAMRLPPPPTHAGEESYCTYSTRQRRCMRFLQSAAALPGLRVLALARVAIGAAGSAALARCLRATPDLVSLLLDETDVCMHMVVPAFKALPALTRLRVAYERGGDGAVGLRDLGASALAGSITTLRSMAVLELNNAQIGDRAFAPLLYGIAGLHKLQELRLKGCCLARSTVWQSEVVGLIASGAGQRLQLLNLDDNPHLGQGSIWIAAAFPFVTSLSLRHCGLFPHDMAALGVALAVLTSLQSLDIARNSVQGTGMGQLGPCLGRAVSLRAVGLADTGLGDRGAVLLSRHIGGMQQLRACRLGKNRIGDAAGETLALALAALPELERVDLSANQLGDRAACALRCRLRMLCNLRVLRISGNRVCIRERAAMAKAAARLRVCVDV